MTDRMLPEPLYEAGRRVVRAALLGIGLRLTIGHDPSAPEMAGYALLGSWLFISDNYIRRTGCRAAQVALQLTAESFRKAQTRRNPPARPRRPPEEATWYHPGK